MKVFGVVMTLLLVFSLAATFSVSSTVSAGTQKWTKISIPSTDDIQLAPLTHIGVIAVSPHGATLFAAVYAEVGCTTPGITALNWYVFKSIDGGYTWKVTGYVGDGTPTERIVAIDVSPAWEDDDILVVATTANAWISDDRGKTFQSMGATTLGTINSLDVALDSDGDATYVIGTTSDVYILSGFSGWKQQFVGAFSALAVAFSPNYAEDGAVFALVTDGTDTWLRGESDIKVNNWGSFIQDANFVDMKTTTPPANIVATHACLAFAEDYNSNPAVFVGLVAGSPAGDVFRVDLVMGTIGTSAVNNLNIRGLNYCTDVWSLAVSGPASSAFILVGLNHLSNTGPMPTWQGQVHYSSNGGESWLQSYKPPSGMDLTQNCEPTVIMAPDFADSGIAYCGNGYALGGATELFSGFYVSTTQGTTFNGRGLLDHTIDATLGDAITDILPSPDYDSDSTLFMVTHWASGNQGLLWESKNGGSEWELILGMTTMIPIPGVSIQSVEVPATYPDEPSIFVTGPTDFMTSASAMIVRSTDEGNLFATTLHAPYDGATPLPVESWVVIDKDTLIVSNANKVWKTTDMGAHWTGTDDTEIAASENIIDMQIFNDTTVLVSTDEGNVYMCNNWETDFSFVQVDRGPGFAGAGDWAYIAFDTNFDDNGIIYAGIWGTNQGIWRIDANSGDEWEQIWDGGADIYAIRCDGNGILWAIADGTTSQSIREVNPTAPIDDLLPGGDSPFEYVTNGLTSELWLDLETAPTQTYVFAIGGTYVSWANGEGGDELWAYIDTLIKPTLISPSDEATAAGTIIQGTSTARVSLLWDDLAKAHDYEYEVAYDDQFGSIAANDIIEGTQASVNLFLGEKYYWRVRVNGSVYSQWTETWSFTTPLGPASAKPIVIYPGGAEDETRDNTPLSPTLTWTSAVEATGFELIVATNCDWSNPVISLTGSSALGAETAYKITQTLQQGTNYCWKVRAINADTATNSPWSDTGTFTTLVIPAPAEEGTPVWVWVVIALSAVLLVGVVVLIVRTRRPV